MLLVGIKGYACDIYYRFKHFFVESINVEGGGGLEYFFYPNRLLFIFTCV